MRKRPGAVSRYALVVTLFGPVMIGLQGLALKSLWEEGPIVRVSYGAVIIGMAIYLLFLILGLWRGHRWVWHAIARGKWNPFGSRAWNDPEIRDHFGIL